MSPSATLIPPSANSDQYVYSHSSSWPFTTYSNIARFPGVDTLEVGKTHIAPTPDIQERYELRNTLLEFDTGSAIPDEAIILDAKLRMTLFPETNDDSRGLCGEYYNWTGTNATDASATVSESAFDAVALSTFSTPGTVYTFTLKSLQANISSTGMTKIRLHISGAQPVGANQIGIASSKNAAYARPRLVVQYIAVPQYVGASSAFVTGATAVVPPKPAGVVQGDFMICALGIRGGTGQTITPPAGWTLYSGSRVNITTVVAGAIYTKTAGASEPSSYSFGYNLTENASAEIVAYRNLTATQIEVLSSQSNTASTNVTAPTVTNQYVADRLLTVGIQPVSAATTFTPPAGMTERVEQSG